MFQLQAKTDMEARHKHQHCEYLNHYFKNLHNILIRIYTAHLHISTHKQKIPCKCSYTLPNSQSPNRYLQVVIRFQKLYQKLCAKSRHQIQGYIDHHNKQNYCNNQQLDMKIIL